MYRPLLAMALLLPAVAQAQDAPPPAAPPAPRQMPTYQDNDAQWRGGTSETYGTADLHHQVQQTPPPPPVPQGYGYDPYGGGYGGSGTGTGTSPQSAAPAGSRKAPRPYGRQSQVDQGNPDDAAHRADRARTADLNRRPRSGYNAAPDAPITSASGNAYAAEHARYQAELARHAQDMARYQDQQVRYSERVADWQARTYACEQGDPSACDATR